MSLRDWQKNSWLVEHKSSPEEIAALLAIVERGFYVAWDATRGAAGGAKAADRGPEVTAPEAVPVSALPYSRGLEPGTRPAGR